jgi:hypothetical protein
MIMGYNLVVSVRSGLTYVLDLRHRIGHALSKPIFVLETTAHGGYCYAAWAEGHGLYSLMAGVLLAVIVVNAVLGAE